MRVVDTSAFVERFADTPMRDQIDRLLPADEHWLVPTIVQFEIAKWLLRSSYARPIRLARSIVEPLRVVPLTPEIASAAASIWDQYKLATADAIIYATARTHRADLLTCDRHFEGLPDVIYLPKPPN